MKQVLTGLVIGCLLLLTVGGAAREVNRPSRQFAAGQGAGAFYAEETGDILPPETQIVNSIPEGAFLYYGATSVTFYWTGTDNVTPAASLAYAWRLDDGAWSAFSSATSVSLSTAALGEGAHAFEVQARDLAGNVDLTPAVRHFTRDVTPPDTLITAGPASGSTVAGSTVTFAWAGTDNLTPVSNLRYVYWDIKNNAWSSLTMATTVTFTGMPDGPYTFAVFAFDLAGKYDSTYVTRYFTVDATPPEIDATPPETQIVNSIPEGAFLYYGATSVTFYWTGTDNVTPTASLAYAWRLDDGAWSAFSGATSAMFTTAALSEGAHTFAVQARDLAGNVDPTPAVRHFTRDLTPPDTMITAGPVSGSTITGSTVTFAWIGTDNLTPVPSLRYYYTDLKNNGNWTMTTATTATFTDLPDRNYAFAVFAVDLAGKDDYASPAYCYFNIDSAPPDTRIVYGIPEGAYIGPGVTSLAFQWTGTDNAMPPTSLTYAYRLDGDAWSAFTGATYTTFSTAGLSEGPHAFTVLARDLTGNVDPTPEVRHFTRDLTPPDTLITDGPASGSTVTSSTVTFTWTGTDNLTPAASLRYYYWDIKTGTWAPLTTATTVTFTGLPDGYYGFAVFAFDLAGNYDSTYATRYFMVDTAPPETLFTGGVPEGMHIASRTAYFSWSGTDNRTPTPSLTYAYRLDEGEWSVFTTAAMTTVTGLAEGPHTFAVMARDLGGLVDPTPAVRTFTVDLTPPDTWMVDGPENGAFLPDARVAFSWTAADNYTPNTSLQFSHVLDTGAYTPFAAATEVTLADLAEGWHIFGVRARDLAGNVDLTPTFRQFMIDRTAPVTTVQVSGQLGENGWYRSDVTVTLLASDTAGSGVAAIEFSLDGVNWTRYANPFTITQEGVHTLYYRAIDRAGNTEAAGAGGEKSLTISIDKTAPAITLSTAKTSLWPAEHTLIDVGLALSVHDTYDASPVISISVSQNEPVNDIGDGNTAPDAVLITNDAGKVTGLQLRAERAGTGSGRVYLIRVTAADATGNTATAAYAVTVPISLSANDLANAAALAANAVASGVPLAWSSFIAAVP